MTSRVDGKFVILHTLADAREKLLEAQARYEKNYESLLRRHRTFFKPDEYASLRVKRRKHKKTRQKLAPIADVPYRMKEVDTMNKTVVIAIEDRSTENFSRSRVTLYAMPKSADELI